MWDRVINFISNSIKDMPKSKFYIMMAVIITLGFYFLSVFLKANKKESSKVAKVSYLLWSILTLIIFVFISSFRTFG